MTRKNSTPIPLAGLAGLVSFFFLIFCCFLQAGSLPAQADPSAGPGELVARDSSSGLMWQRGDSFHDLNKGLNWYEALEYAAKKNSEKFAGFDDWRLPTMEELNALYDSSRSLKSKDGESIGLPPGFWEGGSYYLWSADERGLDNAWYFGLGHKENYFNLKDLADLDQGARLVRKAVP